MFVSVSDPAFIRVLPLQRGAYMRDLRGLTNSLWRSLKVLAAQATVAPSGASYDWETMLNVGDAAPNFTLPDQEGRLHTLEDYRGRWVVLYFYPKDDTPGCTKEACNFRDEKGRLEDLGAVVLGVSADDVESHGKFHGKYGLNFPLLSNPAKDMIRAYGAWGLKNFMGKEYEGVLRYTYLLDPHGHVVKVWQKVRPDEHAAEVAEALVELQKTSGVR